MDDMGCHCAIKFDIKWLKEFKITQLFSDKWEIEGIRYPSIKCNYYI